MKQTNKHERGRGGTLYGTRMQRAQDLDSRRERRAIRAEERDRRTSAELLLQEHGGIGIQLRWEI